MFESFTLNADRYDSADYGGRDLQLAELTLHVDSIEWEAIYGARGHWAGPAFHREP